MRADTMALTIDQRIAIAMGSSDEHEPTIIPLACSAWYCAKLTVYFPPAAWQRAAACICRSLTGSAHPAKNSAGLRISAKRQTTSFMGSPSDKHFFACSWRVQRLDSLPELEPRGTHGGM